MSEYLGKNTFKLGFGLMRLPKNPDGTTDIPQVCDMVDRFIDAGGTYFDTAYVYDNGHSEEAFRAAVADRYPRDKYTLCTKLNAWMQCHDEASAKQQFYTSLERTNAGYFDYYLLHGLMRHNYTKYDEYHLWDFVREQKEKGLIRHYGFSFHADPALLEEILNAHPEVDFVQLQINYSDWENPGIGAKECWEIARRHGKPITVMEPLKGGALADPIPSVKEILKRQIRRPRWFPGESAMLPAWMALSRSSQACQAFLRWRKTSVSCGTLCLSPTRNRRSSVAHRMHSTRAHPSPVPPVTTV